MNSFVLRLSYVIMYIKIVEFCAFSASIINILNEINIHLVNTKQIEDENCITESVECHKVNELNLVDELFQLNGIAIENLLLFTLKILTDITIEIQIITNHNIK